ncbi:MAG: polyprenyl synthetase family protein [Fimbriimonadia bacterium]|jgi:geranylgeranyl diphosphate synthase type II
MTFEEYASPRIVLVEEGLDRALPPETLRPEQLHRAMRYSALAPGKRIRPLLCIAAAEACGGSADRVLSTACALECIHAFSLIHDDLPALDDDDLRRGRPTCHVAFGEATAILAGDALFALAFQLIAENRACAPDEAVGRVLALLAEASGTAGMVGGQVVDLEAETHEADAETVEYIYERKTGALILASVVSGGILAGADGDTLCQLADYGSLVGRAFQAADDVLNVIGDEATIGKPVGSDAARHKATYVALYGVEGAMERSRELTRQAIGKLETLGCRADPLRMLAEYVVERTS